MTFFIRQDLTGLFCRDTSLFCEDKNLIMTGENYNLTSQEDKSRFNQEQYDILKRCSQQENINEWNSYRADHPEIRIHLQNADLRKARLEGAKLSGADLEGAQLEGADLFAADMKKADLRGANLEGAIVETTTEDSLPTAVPQSDKVSSINLPDDPIADPDTQRT